MGGPAAENVIMALFKERNETCLLFWKLFGRLACLATEGSIRLRTSPSAPTAYATRQATGALPRGTARRAMVGVGRLTEGLGSLVARGAAPTLGRRGSES
eukprot:4868424-Prymnesium_polylepis.1